MKLLEDKRCEVELQRLQENCKVHGSETLPPAFMQVLVRALFRIHLDCTAEQSKTNVREAA